MNAVFVAFVAELKALSLWESTVVVQFSEFGRTLDPNTNFGADHAWGTLALSSIPCYRLFPCTCNLVATSTVLFSHS